jgi:hypothetical protein
MVTAQDWGWESGSVPFRQQTVELDSLRKTTASRLIHLYQLHVSPKQGSRCPAYPSCSSFALQSIERYGWFQGVLMTLERLYYRESPDMLSQKNYEVIEIHGDWKIYDPAEANNIFGHHDWRVILPEYRPQSR